MSEQAVHEFNQAMQALQSRRRDDASLHFWRALDATGDIADLKGRRAMLAKLAEILGNIGFSDLALMAAQDALAIDEQGRDPTAPARTRMTIANVDAQLGNFARARRLYRSIIEKAGQHGDLKNAAAASTNLALIAQALGEIPDALALFKTSLEHLDRVSSPPTEINTCMALLKTLDVADRDSDLALQTANRLMAKYGGSLDQDRLSEFSKLLDSTIARHLRTHKGGSARRIEVAVRLGKYESGQAG